MVGCSVSWLVGVLEGCPECLLDEGCPVGCPVGCAVGSPVGSVSSLLLSLDPLKLGTALGIAELGADSDGMELGRLGETEGRTEGCPLGRLVGE